MDTDSLLEPAAGGFDGLQFLAVPHWLHGGCRLVQPLLPLFRPAAGYESTEVNTELIFITSHLSSVHPDTKTMFFRPMNQEKCNFVEDLSLSQQQQNL